MRRLCALTVLALAMSPAVFADSYRDGRVRYVEEGVSIQRATETGSEEATSNLPFLPGDRVWTDEGGRAEFQFAGGSLLRLDGGSKLDYVAHDEGRDDRIVLRLWSGALFLHVRDRRDGPFEVETPGGVVTSSRGVVRVDVQSGETRVSVYEGEAGLDGAQPVRIRAGERLYARRGEVEEGPTTFDRTEGDDFADWDNGRREQASNVSRGPMPLPDEVAPYADELDRHGAWYYETEVGHVWRPYVAAGWQPYSSGRWVWSIFGWTWVPYETWGWAPSHFGRWGFTPALGWYWIPGAAWSPAWVSWAVGGDYVGWCPLGYRDRPVLVYDRFGRGDRGHAVARGTSVATAPWIYLRRGDIGARDLTRRRVQLDSAAVQQVRVVEAARTRLSRDLAVTERPTGAVARAVPRNTSSRPGMSDTVPEMRSDPMSSIPVVRRRGRPVEGRDDPMSAETGVPAGAVPRSGSAWGRPEGAPITPANATRPPHPTDVRSGQRHADEVESGTIVRRRPGADVEARTPDRPVRERDGVVRERAGVVRERDGASEADRDVLRPMFRPLGRPRSDGQDAGAARDGGAQNQGDSGWSRRRGGDGDAPRGGESSGVRRGDGESRHGGAEARPSGVTREREAAPPRPAPPPRNEPQAQPRHEAPPPAPPSAAARRPRKDQ
jgi:FecR protein